VSVEKGILMIIPLMESFYRTIKRELIQDAHFETPEQAQHEIFKYIELYYNTKRMYSS